MVFAGAGSREKQVALLSCCRGVVFPSIARSEAFGVTLIEAAMFGKPMISTELGTGTSVINRHEGTGLVVRPGDVAAFGAAMRHFLDSPEKAAMMGVAAEARYRKLFTAARMCDSYNQIYRSLLDAFQ